MRHEASINPCHLSMSSIHIYHHLLPSPRGPVGVATPRIQPLCPQSWWNHPPPSHRQTRRWAPSCSPGWLRAESGHGPRVQGSNFLPRLAMSKHYSALLNQLRITQWPRSTVVKTLERQKLMSNLSTFHYSPFGALSSTWPRFHLHWLLGKLDLRTRQRVHLHRFIWHLQEIQRSLAEAISMASLDHFDHFKSDSKCFGKFWKYRNTMKYHGFSSN